MQPIGDKMPCGKESCIKCNYCIYDSPIDYRQKNMRKNFEIFPLADNPSTAQIIIPGASTRHSIATFNEPTQLLLPFKDNESSQKECPYCNGCEYLMKILRPNKNAFNVRCSADKSINGGSERVIMLNVYENEKIKKPFWCPIIKNSLTKSLNDGIKIGDVTVNPNRKGSAMSDAQLEAWNKSKQERENREKWMASPGLTSWDELEVDKSYHLPPSPKKGRMNIRIKNKYISSLQAFDIKTNKSVWLYKEDEEYKYMSPLK